jgi:hypothetical protein
MDDAADKWTSDAADNKNRHIRLGNEALGDLAVGQRRDRWPPRPSQLETADDNTNSEAIDNAALSATSLSRERHQ